MQAPAGLSATIAVDGNPTSASVGQPLTVRVTVQDTGGGAVNVSPPTVSPEREHGGVRRGQPLDAPDRGGWWEPVFTATCTPATSGSLHLAASVSASTVNTGAVLSTDASLASPITVQQPPVLTIIVGAIPSTVDVGQAVSVTFTVVNGGAAKANGVTVTPSVTGAATCGNVAPGATDLGPSGGSQVYTMQCNPTGAGSLVVGGTAAGTDANSGQPVTATTATPATVTVQTAAVLGAAISVDGSPTTLSVGQAVTVRLTVSDTGGAQAVVSSVTPTPAGICMAASPTPPQTVTPGGPVTFTWTCTPSSAGTLTLGASVAGTDKNTGGALTASASLSPSPSSSPRR